MGMDLIKKEVKDHFYYLTEDPNTGKVFPVLGYWSENNLLYWEVQNKIILEHYAPVYGIDKSELKELRNLVEQKKYYFGSKDDLNYFIEIINGNIPALKAQAYFWILGYAERPPKY